MSTKIHIDFIHIKKTIPIKVLQTCLNQQQHTKLDLGVMVVRKIIANSKLYFSQFLTKNSIKHLQNHLKMQNTRGIECFYDALWYCIYIYIYIHTHIHKHTLNKIINTCFCLHFSWAELKDLRLFLCTQKAYFSQMLFTNLSKSVLVSTSPLPG